MTTPQDDMRALVADAGLVLSYAARVGRLQSPDLVVSARRIEESLNGGIPKPEAYATFLKQFSAAVHEIAPVTLLDLGSTWRPYPGSVEHKWLNRVLVMIGIIIIAAMAFYTQLYTIAQDTLTAIHAVQVAEIDEKLDRLRIFLIEHPALEPQPKPPPREAANSSAQDIEAARAVLSSYLKELRAANALALAMRTVVFEINQDDVLYPPLVLPLWRGIGHVADVVVQSIVVLTLSIVHENVALAAPPPTPPSPDKDLPSQDKFFEINGLGKPTVEKSLALANTSDPAVKYELYGLVTLRATEGQWSDYIDFSKRVVLLLGTWFLPAAYGLVGAIVFQMRRVLDPLQPGLPPIRLFFRIALGGFAGIIVTWFRAPSAHDIALGESVSITAFGVAFLVGYSSEIFFVLLDRMVTSLLQAIRPGPTVGAKS